jgi:hypothetical protein
MVQACFSIVQAWVDTVYKINYEAAMKCMRSWHCQSDLECAEVMTRSRSSGGIRVNEDILFIEAQ